MAMDTGTKPGKYMICCQDKEETKMRDGFDELVEEYFNMLGGYDNINILEDVTYEMLATYNLTDTEREYIKIKCS